MKLEFDSVEDLGHFLHWAATELAPRYAARGTDGSVSLTFPVLDVQQSLQPAAGLVAGNEVAFDTPPTGEEYRVSAGAATGWSPWMPGDGKQYEKSYQVERRQIAHALPVGDAQAPANMPPAEPQKRKRRTKAEIEADEQRIAAAAASAAQEGAKAEEPAATNAAATAQPQGANPFAQSEVVDNTVSTPEVVAGGEGDPAEAVVTPFQHLTRAREFIAKHGMPKYNETFAKAGLDANVMAYSAYQRGVHMATMDEFDKA